MKRSFDILGLPEKKHLAFRHAAITLTPFLDDDNRINAGSNERILKRVKSIIF